MDTIDGVGVQFRFKVVQYPGRITMYCQNLNHFDEGSMSQSWILNDPSRPILRADIPWAQDCSAPVDATCDDGPCGLGVQEGESIYHQ
jgi:hypothetical protein